MFGTSGTNRPIAMALLFALSSALPAKADVAIGVLIPSSGKGASYGQQQQNAINMFMAKYSDLGGRAGKLNAHPAHQKPQLIVSRFNLLQHQIQQSVQNQASKIEILVEFNGIRKGEPAVMADERRT